jgi:hypothetical protein
MGEIILYAIGQFLFALAFITVVYLISKEILDFIRNE